MSETQEIYRHSTQKVYLDIYGANSDATPVATFTNASGTTTTLPVVSDGPNVPLGLGGQYHVDLNMAQTQSEGDISVTWTFAMNSIPVSKTDYLSVVSPILSNETIKSIHPNATDDEVASVEKAVRHIIQAHTGQSFGYFVGKKFVRGDDYNRLALPAHLLSLLDIEGNVIPETSYRLLDEGWTLVNYTAFGTLEPTTFNEVETFLTGGVIVDPYLIATGVWTEAQQFEINGIWGYKAVPAQVAEAAKLLVNDYACGDAQYRDRYLTSMTAADWRIQYHSGAFRETGNVRADQLLSDFVLKRGWAVI